MSDASMTAHFESLMTISADLAASSCYEAAYHSASAAMHLADDLGDLQRFRRVESLVSGQHAAINLLVPEHYLSSRAAAARGTTAIYISLLMEVHAIRVRMQAAENLGTSLRRPVR
jgi:hypothetical protein